MDHQKFVIAAVACLLALAGCGARADGTVGATVTVSGTVTSAGAPVAGADVELVWDQSQLAEGETGRCCTVQTSADGRFTISHRIPAVGEQETLPSVVWVGVSEPGFVPTDSARLPVSDGAVLNADVEVAASSTLVGSVVDSAGAPRAGVDLFIESERRNSFGDAAVTYAVSSDAEGRFVIDLVPERWIVTVRTPGVEATAQVVETLAGRRTPVEIRVG